MKRFLLSSFLMLAPFVAFGATPLPVIHSTFAKSATWAVIDVQLNGSPACMLIEKFAKKDFFVLTDSANSDAFNFAVVDDDWKIKQELVKLQIDNKTVYSVQPNVVDNSTFSFSIAGDVLDSFLQNFYTGKNLKLTTASGKSYTLPIASEPSDGSKLSPLAALNGCDVKYISTNPYAPVPLPNAQPTTPPGDVSI